MSDPNFSISGNLIFRGVIVGMFAIICTLSGVIGSQFLEHLASIDTAISNLNVEYGKLTYRIVRIETKEGLQPNRGN